MNIPADLRYTKTHEWIKEENGVVTVGLSDFAQQELGDLVFVNLPQVGDAVKLCLTRPRASIRTPTAHGSSAWRM